TTLFRSYSCSPFADSMTEEFRRIADKWRDAAQLTDKGLAGQIRADKIDILIDLSGHTAGHRLLVFARKPAPVQVTAWGFATGTRLRTIDCMFSDPVCIPRETRPLFAEEIVDLPCCYCYEAPGDGPEVSPLPHLQGQPFTF